MTGNRSKLPFVFKIRRYVCKSECFANMDAALKTSTMNTTGDKAKLRHYNNSSDLHEKCFFIAIVIQQWHDTIKS